MKWVWGFYLLETLVSSEQNNILECKVVPVFNRFHSLSAPVMRDLTLKIFYVYLFSIFCISFSYNAYFKIAWESLDRMLVLPNWSLSPVNFNMHAYLLKSMWKKTKENENLSFYPCLPDSTCVWAGRLLESLTVYLKIYFIILSGVLVERRLSGKGSENPATDFWWWSIHNWITHPLWRLSVQWTHCSINAGLSVHQRV